MPLIAVLSSSLLMEIIDPQACVTYLSNSIYYANVEIDGPAIGFTVVVFLQK